MNKVSREVTAETQVTVVMQGEHGYYSFGTASTLASWCNTLSDLTGYTSEHALETLLSKLPTRYDVILRTAAGDLCPIKFLVTLTASRSTDPS